MDNMDNMDNMCSRYSDRLGEPRPRTRLSRCKAAAKERRWLSRSCFLKRLEYDEIRLNI